MKRAPVHLINIHTISTKLY